MFPGKEKEMQTIRIGLIGYGAMGRTHAYAVRVLPFYYRALPFTAEIVAVHTAHPDTTYQASAVLGCKAVLREEELLADPEVDVIDLCTPNCAHYATLLRALAAHKHIYCEKPLCATATQAEQVARMSEQAGVCHQVVFNNRYLCAVQRAKELIDAGALGRILSFRFCYRHASAVDPGRVPGWKQNRDICGGGALMDLGIHVLDLCVYLCGPVARTPQGRFAVRGNAQIGCPEHTCADGSLWRTNAEEAFYATLSLQCGAVGTLEASKLACGEDDALTFEIYGTDGALRFSLMELDYLAYYDNRMPGGDTLGGRRGFLKIACGGRYALPGGVFPGRAAPSGWLRGHVGAMYAFLDAVAAGRQSDVPFSHGAYLQQIISQLYQDAAAHAFMGSLAGICGEETNAINKGESKDAEY